MSEPASRISAATESDAAATVRRSSWLRNLKPLLWIVPALTAALAIGWTVMQRRERAESAALITESEPARQPVRVATAQRAAIRAWVFAEGTARSVQREYLTFEMSGRVTFVGPTKEGQAVKKGEVLAQLDKRKYAADVDAALAGIQEAQTQAKASQTSVSQAKTQYELAKSQYARIEQLHRQNAATDSALEESKANLDNAEAGIEAAQAQAQAVEAQIAVTEAKLRQAQIALEEAEIVSPIDGIVAYLNIEEGYYFTQNFVKTSSESEALQTIPLVVIDPSQYEIIVDVPSFEAERIEPGQSVLLLPGGTSESATVRAVEGPRDESTGTAPGWEARGEVYSVNPAINPGGRSIQVKIRTSSGAANLRDGMFVTCWVATEEKPDAVVAPLDALLYEENRPYVFVLHPDEGVVERRAVVLGIQGLTQREIASGVEPGEQLVTDGRYRLVDGAPVRVLEGTNGPPRTVMHHLDAAVESSSPTLLGMDPVSPFGKGR